MSDIEPTRYYEPDIYDLELARRHLSNFVEMTTNFKLEPWQRQFCDRLELLKDQTGQRIALHAGPQFGKSIIVSQRAPAWFLGHRPDWRIPLACYNETHSETFTGINRDIMCGDDYKMIFTDPGVRVNPNSPKSQWSTAKRIAAKDGQPSMLALGLHSGFTGKGADLLMIDDPYKNRMEAYSTTTREAIWMWWLQVAKVRITPEANVLLTFHRWHDDDLAGRLIAEGGWEVIRFPAIADDGENDPTGRERGEPLSKRYSIAHLTSIKEADEAGFSALFQGKPVKEGGNIIKEFWWRFWYPADKPAPSPVTITLQDGTVKECEQMPLPALADMDRLIQSWDTNLFESATSDYTVGQAWGKRGALKFLLDQVREHADSPITQQMLIDFSAKHPTIMAKYIEFKAAGVDVYRKLSNVVEGLIKVTPKGEKTMRAHAITPTIQAGNVYLPHPTLFPWVTGLIGECSVFPAGANDDQVDTMTQALSKLTIAEYEEKPEATLTDEERWVRISRRIGAPMPDDAEEDAL